MAVCDLIGRRRHHDVIKGIPNLTEKLRINVLLLQFQRLYESFRLGFDYNECNYKK